MGEKHTEMSNQKHDHQKFVVVSRCPDCGEEISKATFNKADFEAQQLTELPDREAMSLVNANVAAPINAALALNVLSDGSVAYASATQYAPITETS